MARMVLLNLPDDQVDVLTRIQQTSPGSQVVVVHPDEHSLIRRLARLTDLESLGNPPQADAGDVVIALSDIPESLLRPWNAVGASVVRPAEMGGLGGSDSRPENGVPVEADEPKLPKAKPAPLQSESLSFLASPEATFRYVVEQTLGSDQASLWWDGNLGLWTRWIGSGGTNGSGPPEGFQVKTDRGRFVIEGLRVESVAWDVDVLKRVLDDLAIRDAVEWNEVAAKRPELLSPAKDPAVWFATVADLLQPAQAVLAAQQGGDWKLDQAWGSGFGLTGTLSSELLQEFFKSWQRLNVSKTTAAFFRFLPDSGRWPLKLKRLEILGRGGA